MSYFTEQRLLDSTPTTTLLTKFHDMITAHAAWDYVEDSTDGAFTVRTYKSDGTLNGEGKDFYLHFSFTTAAKETNGIYVQASEGWDTGAKKLIRGCVNPATTFTPEATYNSATGATAYVASSTNWNRVTTIGTSQVDMTYWVVVTSKGFWCYSTSSTYLSHAGLFLPLWSHANEYPLFQAPLGNTDQDASGSVSRRPSETSSMSDAFAVAGHNTNGYSLMMGTAPNTGALYDKAYGTRFVVSHTTPGNGTYRGLLYDFLLFSVDAVVAIGDTIDIGTDTYVCLYDTGSLGYFVNTEAS